MNRVHDHYLTEIVTQHDSEPEEGRDEGEYIHASTLIRGTCPRFLWLSKREELPILRRVQSADRIVWTLGRAAETHVRNQLLKSLKYSAFGRWHCQFCNPSAAPPTPYVIKKGKEKCRVCKRDLSYSEFILKSDEYRITGSVDFMWLASSSCRDVHIAEIKSINVRDFKELKGPKADHVRQVEFYRYLASHLGYRVFSTRVFYVCKDYLYQGVYAEYVIQPQEDDVWSLLAVEDAQAANGKTCPPRLQSCASPNSSVAKKCSLCHSCFSYGSGKHRKNS